MIKAIIGWVATLIIVGFMSAIFMALGIFTPNLRSLEAVTVIKSDTLESSQALLERAAGVCPNFAVGQPDYQVLILTLVRHHSIMVQMRRVGSLRVVHVLSACVCLPWW